MRAKIRRRDKRLLYHFSWGLAANARRSSDYWDFGRDGLSPSAIQTFLLDREQFRLGWVEGYRFKGYKAHLEFGKMIHYLHEHDCRRGPVGSVAKLITQYLKKHPMPDLTATQKSDRACQVRAVEVVWEEYRRLFADDLEREWVFHESPLEMKYRNTTLRGVLDGAFEDDDGVRLWELKNQAQINRSAIRDVVHLEVQMMTYCVLIEDFLGKCPIGIQRQIVRRPNWRKTNDQRLEAQNLRRDIRDRPDHWFVTIDLDMTPEDLEDWKKYVLGPIVDEIRAWTLRVANHYPAGAGALRPRPWEPELARAVAKREFGDLTREKAYDYHKNR